MTNLSYYSMLKNTIEHHDYDLENIKMKIDRYFIEGRLTNEQFDELTELSSQNAVANVGDYGEQIQILFSQVNELRREIDELKNQVNTQDDAQPQEETIEPWHQPTGAHDAYYRGDKMIWENIVYTCIAPEHVACVWDPRTKPNYWTAIN